MTDVVALTSVVSSGAVALGGLWVTYRGGRDQRKHEANLAYEARAWEKKTEGLFSVISIARGFVDTLSDPSDYIRATFAIHFTESRYELDELVPVVEAYASPDCRAALDDLRSLLRDGNEDVVAAMRVEAAREHKLAAIDAQDFEAAALARDKEREALERANEGLSLDTDEVVVRARRLIDAARASVRGDS